MSEHVPAILPTSPLLEVPSAPQNGRLIAQLELIARQKGLSSLADDLSHLWRWVADDLAQFETQMRSLPVGASRIEKAAQHLLDMGGKHLRPLCLAVASKAGSGFDERARQLAVAVELVHSATLLHDDVIDMAESRRGHHTSRMIYGNAASIYAGDWLLVQALMRVQEAGLPELMSEMLAIINDMVHAECLQLENRGHVNASFDDYFQVVEGKTAALFRWALRAGAVAGGLDASETNMLESYGRHLGIAFQAIDDLLDINGDAQLTGKALFADLREGKMTYPVLIALDRDPGLIEAVTACAQTSPDEDLPESQLQAVLRSLRDTGAIEASRKFALKHSTDAVVAIADLRCSDTRRALTTVAEATTFRKA